MPILITTADFTDNFGNTTGFYRSNVVDKVTAVINVESLIRITSQGNPLILDPSLNQVTSSAVSWIKEGFRVGDWVLARRHNSGGGVMNEWWTQITYVDDVLCDFTTMPFWYSIQNSQFMVLRAVVGNGSYVSRSRDDMDVLVNHVKNSVNGSEFSLIDGEVTRALIEGIAAMPVAGTIAGTLTGNQSGQFLESVSITRNTNTAGGWFSHDITIEFMNSGLYDASWFASGECLKAFVKLLWSSYAGEPFAKSEGIYNLQANTGRFDQAHNTSITDSVLVAGAGEIDYCDPSTFDVIVDGPLIGLGIGSAYNSTDETYYKSRPYPQQELAMVIPTAPAVVGVLSSFTNEFGAGYDLEVNSIVTLGTVHTINVTITPNASFNNFMGGVEDGDRLFYLWVKCGNLNLLAFQNQLTCAPAVGGPLIMERDSGYLDHSQNVEDAVIDMSGFIADTEDDVAYVGKFLLEKGAIYDTFTAKIEAFNTTSFEDFTLQQAIFSFAGVQISNDGRYLLNETIAINTELPNTSVKRNAVLVLEPALDTLTHYGVKIYIPWVLNWRYWQPLLGANVDFYPTQDRNWEQYDNLGDWTIRTELELVKDGLSYVHDNTIIDLDYNSEAQVTSIIELLTDPALVVVTAMPVNGPLMRIRSEHTRIDGFDWDPLRTWGMITIEDNEQQPRWICSSVVDFDNNTANPLTPLSGLLISIQYPTPDVAVLECYFDPTKLNLSAGASITAKIKENDKDVTDFMIWDNKAFSCAYSVMKVSDDSVWNGRIMRVRRSSDNAEQDFSAVLIADQWIVDADAVVTFVGNGVGDYGFVTDWEDQANNSHTASQATMASQPYIVVDGVAITDPVNGILALKFDGVQMCFDVASPIATTGRFMQALQMHRSQTAALPVVYHIGLGNSVVHPQPFYWTAGYLLDNMGGGPSGNIHASLQIAAGSYMNLVYSDTGTDDIEMRQNGVQLATVNDPHVVGSLNKIGRRQAVFHIGLMQELIFQNNQAIDPTFVEGNMNFRYETF